MSEQDLIEGLSAGDETAFDTIFRTHYADLVHLAERFVFDRQTAEEIAQEVFVELWRRRTTIALQSTIRAYLMTATRNRALNRIRFEKIRERAEPLLRAEAVDATSPPDRAAESEIDEAVRSAVSGLPDRCREVFELSRTGGLRYAEIAEVMGISVKTVEAQMGKALRILRERLDPYLGEGDL